MPYKPSFSSAHEKALKGVFITDTSPGTIVRDFNILLDYLGKKNISVRSRLQLPLHALPQINALLTHPIQLNMIRPQLKSYPHIYGLHLIMQSSGLTYIEGEGKKKRLLIDKLPYLSWKSLNPTEQYFTLLETWLFRSRPEISWGGRVKFFIFETLQELVSFFKRIPKGGLQISGNKENGEALRYLPGWHNLGLLELFGLITIQRGAPEAAKGWHIENIYHTAFGDAILAILCTGIYGNSQYYMELESQRKIFFGVLQPLFHPYFSHWENNLSLPKWVFRKGRHIYKISLGNLWFRIAILADQTLDSLASAILEAVEFNNDHLYRFTYESRFGAMERIYHPLMNEEGPSTNKVLVGDVPLRLGQTMYFLFDFGDNWEFDVTLEDIDQEIVVKESLFLEIHGRPPKQYSSWDD